MKEINLLKPLLKQIVSKALNDNGWGVYLKSDPITRVPVQQGTSMWKITDIDPLALLDAIDRTEIEE